MPTTVSGHIKPSGTICAKVEYANGEHHFVTVKLDGTTTCDCEEHANDGSCRHVTIVLKQCHTFPTYDELTQDCSTTTVSQPTTPTKIPRRRMLLSLQDNRSLDEKIFGTLLPYKQGMDRLARYR